ncbi:hypothetical protein CAEBREN_10120 [Caenorhabditis brenneri]|uniref:HAT C-terminal dimerisation domain-containing protein n=1 Tax=Caenorhabditis brenneri TaxID=135651 RepID=G0P9M3_CAEBE|nr:hypothetical protein CAEBREN_10120 [Caenorhabditis brenneri]
MRPKKSKYDEYFIRSADRAECRICSARFNWNMKNGTNSFRLHLATYHKDVMRKLNIDILEKRRGITDPLYQRKFEENADSGSEPSESHDEMDESEPADIDDALVSMICQESLPLDMLNSRGFNHFLQVLAPNFELKPKGHYTDETVPALISRIENKIQEELLDVKKVAIAIDTYQPESTIYQVSAVHVYYMNLTSMTLKNIFIDYRVTLKDQPIDIEPLLSRLPDPDNTIDKTITFHQHFNENPVDDEGPLPSLNGLFDDIIHETFDPDLIEKQKIVLLEYLEDTSYGLSLDASGTGLTRDVLRNPERLNWMQMKEVLELILGAMDRRMMMGDDGDIEDSAFHLTDEEHEVSQFMIETLNNFEEPTTSNAHRFYPTASVIIPALRVLGFHLEDLDEKYIYLETQDAVIKLHGVIESKFEKCQKNMILKTATYLDPRFRGRFFSEPHEEYMKRIAVPRGEEQEVDPQRASDFEKELLEYKSEALDSLTDPCEYWKTNQQRFPILQSLIGGYLAIPASVSPVQELFEIGEKICPLAEDTIEDHQNLIYCHVNLEEYGN